MPLPHFLLTNPEPLTCSACPFPPCQIITTVIANLPRSSISSTATQSVPKIAPVAHDLRSVHWNTSQHHDRLYASLQACPTLAQTLTHLQVQYLDNESDSRYTVVWGNCHSDFALSTWRSTSLLCKICESQIVTVCPLPSVPFHPPATPWVCPFGCRRCAPPPFAWWMAARKSSSCKWRSSCLEQGRQHP